MSNPNELHVPTDEEVAALDPAVRAEMAAALLRGIEPGRQPLNLFMQFCRHTVASTVEIVPIREREEPEIWLDRRSQTDAVPSWRGKWTLPGVAILTTDRRDKENTLEGPIARLFESELNGVRRIDVLHQIPTQFRFDGRGNEATTQYWTRVETGDEPYQGRFFKVEDLREAEPEGGLLEEGWLTIDRAIAEYKTLNT